MWFNYTLLLIVFFFPFIYKLGYWGSVFDAQDYGFLRSGEYLLSKRWFPKIYHFWVFIEAPMFALSFMIFYNPLFEIFLYNIMFYFLLLYNVFVFGKIFRGRFHFPKPSSMFFLITIVILWIWWGSILFDKRYIYIYIAWTMFLMSFYFLCIEALKKSIKYVFINNGRANHSEK